jgi:protein SSD1
MKRLGLDLDGSSAGALMKSFSSITDKNERLTLQHLSTRSMQRAKYFCTGSLDISKYAHYALSVPLYTHFTSPIRRYADIMVHRQLEAILLHEQQLASSSPGGAPGGDPKFSLDTETVAKIAQVCNTKKEAARLAQEQSQHLFLCVLISDLTKRYGPVIRTATVIGVLDQAYDVLVPEFGQLEKRLRIADLPTEVS